MKKIAVIIMLFAHVALAEEDKYEELTTTDGNTYKSVVVRTVTPSEIRIMHDSGVASIKLENLSKELQEKYGYDAEKAKEHAIIDKQNRLAEERATQKLLMAEAQVAARNEAQKEAEKQAVRLRGEIRQVIKEGMLIYAHYGNERMPVYDAGKNRPNLFKGDFLLVGHPNQDRKVDNDWFDVDAVYVGIHGYTTVLGSNKRIRVFKVIRTFK